MQDITDREFWRVVAARGGADVYYTEYFRVHPTSRLEAHILRSIDDNPTGRPAVAQLIGNDIPALVASAKELQQHPIAGIDFNLGCPAPVVYRKRAGGGLLPHPDAIDAILGALREAVRLPLSVKTRLGFDTIVGYEELLRVFARHRLDLVTVHARLVTEMYRSKVRYPCIAQAAQRLPCPVLANGNIYSAEHGLAVLAQTRAHGLMIGRGAIRNPWIFQQLRDHAAGRPLTLPAGRDVLAYIRDLLEATRTPSHAPTMTERSHVERIKKHLNFICLGVEPTGRFLERARRATSEVELLTLCSEYLDHDRPLPLEPFALQLGERDVLAGEHR